jgi:hypothetical protein
MCIQSLENKIVSIAKIHCEFLARPFEFALNFDVMKLNRGENWSVSQNPTQHRHHPADMERCCVTTSGLSRHKNHNTFEYKLSPGSQVH